MGRLSGSVLLHVIRDKQGNQWQGITNDGRQDLKAWWKSENQEQWPQSENDLPLLNKH